MKRTIGLVGMLLLSAGVLWAQSLGEVARQVRAERARKDTSKVRVFTNDNLPSGGGGVSSVGSSGSSSGAAASGDEAELAAEGEGGGAAAEGEKEKTCDEPCWRGKFAEVRGKIDTARREIQILEREYQINRTQYYQDPNQAVREQYSNNTQGGTQLQQIQQQIEGKRAEIAQFERDLSNLEDELRRAGGNPSWAR